MFYLMTHVYIILTLQTHGHTGAGKEAEGQSALSLVMARGKPTDSKI